MLATQHFAVRRRAGAHALRAFSTKKPSSKKMNAKYAVQNVQASFSFLFNSKSSTMPPAVVANLDKRFTAAQKGSSTLAVADHIKSQKDASLHFMYENSKREETQTDKDKRAFSEQTQAKNQKATISYLFTNTDRVPGNSQSNDIAPPSRRRSKKRDNAGTGSEHPGNDVLMHQNVLKSMRFLFGSQVML